MTREEAINHLKTVAKSAIDSGYDSAIVDAVYMAREALEQEPCEDWYDVPSDEMTLGQARQAVKDLRKMWAERLEQEPCEDCISRHAVLSIIECHKNIDGNDAIVWIEKEIGELPPVTPQPKIGRWLEKEVNSDKVIEEWQSARCSVCDRYHTAPYMYYFSHYDYCPNCGTRMEGRQKVDQRRSKRNR